MLQTNKLDYLPLQKSLSSKNNFTKAILVRDQHSSLFVQSISDANKVFVMLANKANITKLFIGKVF
jgi:hypothetical protein